MTSRGRHLEIKSVTAAASAAAVNPNVTMGVCMFEKFRISINCSHLKELDITRLVEIILKLTDVY